MSLTIGVSAPRRWKGARYIAAACGLALAVSGIAAAGGLGDHAGSSAEPAKAISSSPRQTAPHRTTVYTVYAVGTQAAADQVHAMEGEVASIASSHSVDLSHYRYQVFMLDSPDAIARFDLLVGQMRYDLEEAGNTFNLIDMRDK
jgi:hypothetical protein